MLFKKSILIRIALLFSLIIIQASWSDQHPVDGEFFEDAEPANPGPHITLEVLAGDDAAPAPLSKAGTLIQRPPIPGLPKYGIYPMAGNVWRDVHIGNYTDLDDVGDDSVRIDWSCNRFNYEGHHGHDTSIRSFGYQDVGVPLFAILDGRVASIHDGEFDKSTSSGGTGNHVILVHKDGLRTLYWHFKKDSIIVQPNQWVRAGETLGMTGSSGSSTAPHLHFQSEYLNETEDWQWFEPNTGDCNEGSSLWEEQIPLPEAEAGKAFLFDFDLKNNTIQYDSAHFPRAPTESVRHGSFVKGNQTIYMRFRIQNAVAGSIERFVFKRPDGSIARTAGTSTFSSYVWRSWRRFGWTVNLNVAGTWTLEYRLGSQIVKSIPFTVVNSAAEIVNRPPYPINGLVFDPVAPSATDVIFCRLDADQVVDDPDFDIVRYRYLWKVNGETVRDNTFACHSDAIPWGKVLPGDTLTCEVTVSDGTYSLVPISAAYVMPGVRPTPTPTPTPLALDTVTFDFEDPRQLDYFDVLIDPTATSDERRWCIAGGKLRQDSNVRDTGSYQGTYAIPDLAAWNDYEFEFDINSHDNDIMGCVWRYRSSRLCYALQWAQQQNILRLVKFTGSSSSTTLAQKTGTTFNYVARTTYHVHLTVNGNQSTVVITGPGISPTILSFTDSTHQSGPPGFYCWANNGTLYDNMQYRAIGMPPTPTPIPGDVNFDGDKNLLDLLFFSMQWRNETGFLTGVDLNKDSEVDAADLLMLINNLQK
jgi:Peptidase family M23/Dockerin type I domain